MTENWFIQDIDKQLQQRNRAVILDPTRQCDFLLPLLEKQGYKILKTDDALQEEWQTVQEELFLRYEAESKYKNDKVVFYVTRNSNKLSFLFDYCFTHGCLDLSKPSEWLKGKLFSNTGLQINMDNPLLLTAAKLGMGKDISWWKKILQNLEDLVAVEDELLPFLDSPDEYLNSKEPDIKRLFEEKLFEIIGQPFMNKPPQTLATEIATLIFDKLANNDIDGELLNIYYKWIDSNTYSETLKKYLSKYKISPSVNVWGIHPDHCFEAIDKMALINICDNIRDGAYIKEKIQKLEKRASSNKVAKIVPTWWNEVISILEFDSKPLAACNNFDKIVSFYTSSFHNIDRAIRKLYALFLNEEKIIRPLQEYYESINHQLLQHWFDYTQEYKSNQQGYLPLLLNVSKPKTAIIVGDGVRYEIAEFVAKALEKTFKVERNTMLADMPSETEHNMSALYVGNNEVLAIHKDREKRLSEATGKALTFINLEALHYGMSDDYLILTYKDIDSAGEKLQQGAIKLFDEFEKVLTEKISLLLNMGYNEVHLVTDHGFVLTGLLDEADKIDPNANGKKEVHERFIRTVDKQTGNDWIAFDKKYEDYNFVYASRSHRPFKSKGVYGFSHGGFTPQEIIIPNFIFRKEKEINKGLQVEIINKKELSEVTGELFGIKLQAATSEGNLFSASRKIQIMLYANGINYNTSNIITMDPNTAQTIEFSFNGNKEVQVILVDATTQEQLDSTKISKSNARDFGGLL
jgi:hypothetical protein